MQTGSYANPYTVAAAAEPRARAAFIQNTYLHLAGAILGFVGLEALLLRMEWSVQLAHTMAGNWWMVLIAFIAVSWVADRWAHSAASPGKQYAGLCVFIVAEAIIFMPLLLLAGSLAGGGDLIGKAAVLTFALFAGLTVIAFTSKKDFSFLGGFLKISFFVIAGLIAASFIFPSGLNLGMWFSVGMVAIAGCSILYSTSNIIHHYRTDQYVAASLGLFAGVALLFWYVLQILISFGRD